MDFARKCRGRHKDPRVCTFRGHDAVKFANDWQSNRAAGAKFALHQGSPTVLAQDQIHPAIRPSPQPFLHAIALASKHLPEKILEFLPMKLLQRIDIRPGFQIPLRREGSEKGLKRNQEEQQGKYDSQHSDRRSERLKFLRCDGLKDGSAEKDDSCADH